MAKLIPASEVTLVIHGTFAKDQSWWRLGDRNAETFADRLELALSKLGTRNSVWKPALGFGLEYDDFSWSGENTHRARVTGAQKIRQSLEELGKRSGATPNSPLSVNLVAHSHGGNVVLEALRSLGDAVCVNRLVLLGTPLITRKPAFRLGRFISSLALLGLGAIAVSVLFVFLALQLWQFVSESVSFLTQSTLPQEIVENTTQDSAVGQSNQAPSLLTWALIISFSYLFTFPLIPWYFWILAEYMDALWRLPVKLYRSLASWSLKPNFRMYGPSNRVLRRKIRAGKILALRGRNDEADILLQVTSAPERLYMEYVKNKLHRLTSAAELIFFRPFILGAALKVLEVLMERIAFGVSWFRVLFTDYGIWSPDSGPYYTGGVFAVENLSSAPSDRSRNLRKTTHAADARDSVAAKLVESESLGMSLMEIKKEIAAQISLRHSAYYQDRKIIDRIASFLAGKWKESPEPKTVATWPNDAFWEYSVVISAIMVSLNFGILPVKPITVFDPGYLAAILGSFAITLLAFTKVTWNLMPRWQPLLRWVIWLWLSLQFIWMFFFTDWL